VCESFDFCLPEEADLAEILSVIAETGRSSIETRDVDWVLRGWIQELLCGLSRRQRQEKTTDPGLFFH
jgi:hypothetical protein